MPFRTSTQGQGSKKVEAPVGMTSHAKGSGMKSQHKGQDEAGVKQGVPVRVRGAQGLVKSWFGSKTSNHWNPKEKMVEGEVPTVQQESSGKPTDGPDYTWEQYGHTWRKIFHVKYEKDEKIIARRRNEISLVTEQPHYKNYIMQVPKTSRSGDYKECPRTPPLNRKMSRRSWDGQIKAWKIGLHAWD